MDIGKFATVFGGLLAVALLVLAIAIAIAGANQNSRIDTLRAHGVHTEITVTGCIGNLGGSGSNVAGYDCTGTYTFGGHRHSVSITSVRLLTKGATVRAVAAGGTPPLIRTVSALADQRASNGVYVLPGTLALGDLALVILAVLIRRRRRTSGAGSSALA